MKLVEKKCPNCGAGLSFNDTDKSCKCEYCKRSFEIERDKTVETSSFSDQFNLSEMETPLKVFGAYMAGTYIMSAIIGIIVFIIIGIVGFNIYKTASSQFSENSKFLTSVSEISNEAYEDIDFDAGIEIINSAKGNNTKASYHQDGNIIREKVYVASKDDGNMVVAIYKVDYKDLYNSSNYQSVYVPVIYENIIGSQYGAFDNPQVKTHEYYLDSEQKIYVYGYKSIDEAYDDIIKPLEKDYKITKK